jgi:uncharacterized membrane protein (UPF0127 family)
MIERIVIIDKKHDLKHYTSLSLQTFLVYVVFLGGLFSVPAAKIVAQKISAMEVQRAVIGETVITLDIAKTQEQRTKGLSGRIVMPKNHAMLFIFEEKGRHGIWMKEMNFALDIVWLNEFNEVVHIEKNISPETFPNVFIPPYDSKYVLEFNAGFTSKNNIKSGDLFVLM